MILFIILFGFIAMIMAFSTSNSNRSYEYHLSKEQMMYEMMRQRKRDQNFQSLLFTFLMLGGLLAFMVYNGSEDRELPTHQTTASQRTVSLNRY